MWQPGHGKCNEAGRLERMVDILSGRASNETKAATGVAMASVKHDLAVIGAGPGGYIAAIRAAQLGLAVACIDREDKPGGTCLRIGCIPSKALLESSARFHGVQRELADHGIVVDGASFDLGAMMARKQRIVDELTSGVAGLFRKYGVRSYHGSARLLGGGRIALSGAEPLELEARHIIIATGSEPAPLKGIDADGEYIGDSTTGLGFGDVPERLCIIGAGYIGVELGSVWSRLGSRVLLLEYLDRILPGTDSELAHKAQAIFSRQGLEFRLGARIHSARVEDAGARRQVVIELDGGESIRCDRLLVATGRRPCTAGLGLEESGIKLDGRGFIQVDGRFETSLPGVYAIGDVIGGPMLAHKASHEGAACAELIAGGTGEVNYAAIPAVVYTEPELASVGQTEDALIEAGVDYRKGVSLFRANGRAKALGAAEGFVKVLADKETDRLLGVHILGPRAGDLIGECALALEFGAASEDIARTCHAHPTLAEALQEAAAACYGKPLNS